MTKTKAPSKNGPVEVELKVAGSGYERVIAGTVDTSDGENALATLIRETDKRHESMTYM